MKFFSGRVFIFRRQLGLLHSLALFLVLCSPLVKPAPAYAQPDGFGGWGWQGVLYATAEDACRAQWQWAGWIMDTADSLVRPNSMYGQTGAAYGQASNGFAAKKLAAAR